MISDSTIIKTLQQDWQGVHNMVTRIDVLVKASFAQGASAIARLADIPHNLPFLLACGVFNDALIYIRDAGHFSSKQRTLGALVKDGEKSLKWLDYVLIEEIVKKRNDLAHRAVTIPRGDCQRYITALEAQFKAWKVLP